MITKKRVHDHKVVAVDLNIRSYDRRSENTLAMLCFVFRVLTLLKQFGFIYTAGTQFLHAVPVTQIGSYTGCPDISYGFPQYLQQNI